MLNVIKIQMERSVRMLGVQPLDRLGRTAKLPSLSLLWRAVLEVIKSNYKPELDNKMIMRC